MQNSIQNSRQTEYTEPCLVNPVLVNPVLEMVARIARDGCLAGALGGTRRGSVVANDAIGD